MMPNKECMTKSNRVALVTGASRGLGRAIASRLAEDGFTVVVNYLHSEEEAKGLCEQINACESPQAWPVQADVSQLDSARAMFAAIHKKFGRLDVLVNNAGIKSDRLLLLANDQEWWKVVQTNLGSVVNCSRLALPRMLAHRRGIIINITSISGIRGVAGQTSYSASKAAIVGFSKALSREVASRGVAINCVAPGLIDTDLIQDMSVGIVEQYVAMNPMNRLGKVNEVAALVALLASGQATYMTGQVIGIDGGAGM
jgi:3-oxoacyl-[acyl-carrier protein] reductase